MGMIAETFTRVALGQTLAPHVPVQDRPVRRAPRPQLRLAAPMQGGPFALGVVQGLVGLLRGPQP
ncbi:hypothetical protein [Frigidibacter sp.]|uniref:hypothetical protein n=1 Tax=Frigidibacter sp. TaxID=2586418 RepID=UPI0027366321|nr:hypothetical protein [Frigidibacter sp.]MDP3340129.1 hypothetical protein [Frigidibacter sp.]